MILFAQKIVVDRENVSRGNVIATITSWMMIALSHLNRLILETRFSRQSPRKIGNIFIIISVVSLKTIVN
jgi:hypothetical protein